ncbi:MFS transporter, PPP family, 3-phenylpropionic acid transporter [Noviherbaspirillum humi]|uniref:MFS transporter, PPP family, 3-phenylpropionic acid transporter n=1 Tax=Noviherbaspirillum humi TaxID=1688639 RepID=A0A239KTN2_9BURK|nr:MFS transporter [Noviherbaspirillum humi]SNT20594.1 MFS transporter, PPP family, 3-phenylpropionic acid transporter [Noviherbaspirillum humi]
MHQPIRSRQFASFALFFFAYYGYVGVFSPYASLYFADKGMNAAQIGLLMSLMQVMRIFGPNLWGWIADHTGKRVGVLRLTALAAVSCFGGMFFGSSFTWFFLVMVAVNTFTSAQGPLSEALMLSEMRGDLSHYGRIRLWGSVGFIASVSVAGKLLDWWGIDAMPWIALSLLALVLAASLSMREAPAAAEHGMPPAVASLLRRPEVAAFFASTFLMIAAHASLYVFYSLYLAQLGYSNTLIGLMWSLGVIVEIVFFYYQAPLFRHFGIRKLMLASLWLGVIRFLLIGYGADSVVLLLIAQVLHAATFATHHSASVATLQRWFSGPLQARGQALFTSISYGLGGTLGGLILGYCWDSLGSRTVYLAAALFSLLAAVAAALSYRWQARGHVKGE